MIPKLGRSLYGILFFFSILLPIVKIYKSFRFNVIFATWAYPDSFAGMLIAKMLKIPIITKVHGTDINEYSQYWLRRRMISFTLNNSDRVISVSKALKKRMIDIGVRSEKIKVIYNGIDNNIFRPLDRTQTRKELGINFDKKVILFVGNLKPVKGLDYLIDAFMQVV
ncbi:MAG: glycosyltransferase, partial [candidate division WOR-3 bacterium]